MSAQERVGPSEREVTESRIPAFTTIAEEAESWDTHDSAQFEDEFETVTDVRFVKAERKRELTRSGRRASSQP